MANQPKKYKKFVATAATATLVASAIVPVASAASFTDVPGDHEFNQYINELVEAGIIKGYPDGTFGLYKQLKRSDVVKMLGRYLEANGVEVPADWATVQRFSDVPVTAQDQELVKYAALVKDAGVFTGSNGKLNYTQNIQRQQMAKVLNNAYEKINGKSLIDLAAEIEDVKVADLDKAFDEFRPYIQALADLKITTVEYFRPADAVTRGQFAKFLSISIKGGDATTPTPAEVQIKSATATGVSQITVDFNKAVDTEAAKFAVARGTTAITVKDIDWNEAKTQAVITVDHKFVDATYTLTVSGLAEKDLTASFTTTREEVTKIEFLSDRLVLTGREDNAGNKEAVIAFSVYNQYGEEITKNVNKNRYDNLKVRGIKTIKESADFEKGKIVVWVDKDEDEGETGSIEFTYVNGDYELDAYQDVVLSEVSEPADVEILDIYNSGNKALTTDNLADIVDLGEEFYVLFKVKDQYGVEIDAEFADKRKNDTTKDTTLLEEVQKGVRVSVSNKDIFDLDDEDNIDVVNVNGEYYFGIKLVVDKDDLVGGENTVTFKAKATGNETSKVFKVEQSSKVYKVELEYPDDVIAGGETVKLPVTVTDVNGDEVTNTSKLNDDLRSGRIDIDWDKNRTKLSSMDSTVKAYQEFSFVEENGKVYLQFETADNIGTKAETEELDIEIEVEDGEDSEITLKVEPNAYPETLVKLKDNSKTYIYKGETKDLKLKDFVIEDQYGRVFDKADGSFKITVESQSANIETSTDSAKTKFYVKAKQASGTVKFTLESKDYKSKDVTSELNVTFRAVDENDFKSYVVKSDGVLYGVTSQDTAGIEVFGVLSNGAEVKLPKSAYKVLAGNHLQANADFSDVFAAATAKNKLNEPGVTQFDTGVTVVINKTGTQISHKITVSEDEPVVASFELKDKDSIAEKALTSLDLILTSTILDNDKLEAEEIYELLKQEGNFTFEDQYAWEYDNNKLDNNGKLTFFNGDDETLRLTISDINAKNDDDVEVYFNGTHQTSISLDPEKGIVSGDSFVLTLTIDGKEQKVKVYVK